MKVGREFAYAVHEFILESHKDILLRAEKGRKGKGRIQ